MRFFVERLREAVFRLRVPVERLRVDRRRSDVVPILSSSPSCLGFGFDTALNGKRSSGGDWNGGQSRPPELPGLPAPATAHELPGGDMAIEVEPPP